MDLQVVMTRGLAVGVARLVLFTLAAAGFMAMHGVSATDPGGAHHDPMSSSAMFEHAGPTPTDHAGFDTAAPMSGTPLAVAPGEDDSHGLMAACVFVLFSVLVGVALHALLSGPGADEPDRLRTIVGGYRRSRAPPIPIFLTLCVFRL